MNNLSNDHEAKLHVLKTVRLKILALHKVLLDVERSNFEQFNGQITSGQFLNLLVNDEKFQWLRTFSTLIVEIDEMLDLDDGFTKGMIDNALTKIRDLFNFEIASDDFKARYRVFIQDNADVALKHSEIKDLVS